MPHKIYKNKLHHYRLKRNLTQETVLGALGHASASRLSAWENGTATPSLPHLFALAGLYGVSVEKLYGKSNAAIKKVGGIKAKKRDEDFPVPTSSMDMTVEEQLDVLAQLLVEAYIDQKRQNFPHVGSSEHI
jgi:transcriptional regulator with XRE-family HTH domain